MQKSQTNLLLGYPADARLLIVNADDFGLCNSTNEAIIRALAGGFVQSTTVMVPCPWALHALHFLQEHPEVPFGIHLTVISDPDFYRWGPVAERQKVPSLIDRAGYFYKFDDMPVFLARAEPDQLEIEFRAQIETVLNTGLKPTHLDWHSIRFGNRSDIFDLMTRLAKEHGLAQRVIGQSRIENLQSQGLPTIDYDFLDSYGLDPATKAAQFARILHELPAGLSEWAIHPGLDNMELLALEPAGKHERQADFDFLMSRQAREIVKEEGIILLSYRTLQDVWRKMNSSERIA